LIWDEDKLNKLPVIPSKLVNIRGKAEGFGTPVASTILHFIFPDRFPIIDVRTADTFYFVCKINSPNKNDYLIYDQFCLAVHEILKRTNHSIHEIDRASFAYHKDMLNPEMDKEYYQLERKHLPLDAPWKERRKAIDKIKAEAKRKGKP
jgi:hypothetical protein